MAFPVSLKALVDALQSHQDDILERWQRHYRDMFQDHAFLTPEVFRLGARQEIEETIRRVHDGDGAKLSDFLLDRGRSYAAMGVPLADVCETVHLFHESVVESIRSDQNVTETLQLYEALDQLSHEWLLHLLRAYDGDATSAAAEPDTVPGSPPPSRGPRERLCGLVGRGPAMQSVYESLMLAASSRDPVLVVGESGTGKELAARAIHALAGDAPETFVAVNCAALTHDLIESELFGHCRGSFSGADADHLGLFQAAHAGSLLLDEITELIAQAQAKLLRALQEEAVRPVGAVTETPVCIRVIASTNRDLREALAAGKLRRDLFYRLQQLVIRLPPLRERREDIPLLVDHFVEQANRDGVCTRQLGIRKDALALLMAHSWPGNVRELRNTIRLACKRSRDNRVGIEDLPRPIESLPVDSRSTTTPDEPEEDKAPISIQAAEREAIQRALRLTGGNKSEAARVLGISRKQLYVKLRKFRS